MYPTVTTDSLVSFRTMAASLVVARLGRQSTTNSPYTPQTKDELRAWLNGRRSAAESYAGALAHGGHEYRFWGRALDLACGNKPVETIQPHEVLAIVNQYEDDAERLAALEALARPRLAYELTQACGLRATGVTSDELASAGEYYIAYR